MSTEQVDTQHEDGGKKVAIKFLISNSHAGSLIGTGGKSIKELKSVTNARIIVSGALEVFPGTGERVVLISGNINAVDLAQTLVWEMIAQNVQSGSDRSVDWSPEVVVNNLGTNDSVEVKAKITIPAAVGGLILGRGGETIKEISAESGASIIMTSKEEALFTQERVLTISGQTFQCIKCVNFVLSKLEEQEEVAPFLNRGTTYSAPNVRRGPGGFGPLGGGPQGGRGRGRGGRGSPTAGAEAEHETTITMTIPNDIVGNIFGKQGATMREIISLSGANVVVSPRDEFVEGTTNRLVTITGPTSCAQTAHLFISRRLEVPTIAPRKERVQLK